MTAEQLIAELQKLDPQEEIYVNDVGCGCCSGKPLEVDRITTKKSYVYSKGVNSYQTVKVIE